MIVNFNLRHIDPQTWYVKREPACKIFRSIAILLEVSVGTHTHTHAHTHTQSHTTRPSAIPGSLKCLVSKSGNTNDNYVRWMHGRKSRVYKGTSPQKLVQGRLCKLSPIFVMFQILSTRLLALQCSKSLSTQKLDSIFTASQKYIFTSIKSPGGKYSIFLSRARTKIPFKIHQNALFQ